MSKFLDELLKDRLHLLKTNTCLEKENFQLLVEIDALKHEVDRLNDKLWEAESRLDGNRW